MTGVCGNIATALTEMAHRQPRVDALLTDLKRSAGGVWAYRRTTFAQLNDQADAVVRGVSALGIGAGSRVALCLRPGVDFFAVTFGLFKLGAVPVLIDPGIGINNFGKCVAQAKPVAFVGVPLAHLLRRLFGWGKETIRTNVTNGAFGGISLSKVMRAGKKLDLNAEPEADVAAILFTSGSTGPAKGVVYTHDNFLAQVRALQEMYAIEPGEVDLATFPLFGLFGPALGMTTIVPQMNFTRPGFVDPRAILEPIRQLNVTNMFGSPALIERVSLYGETHGVTLPTLRRAISAGAPASPRTLARFSKMLNPAAEIFTPYGATEALPVSSIGSKEILGETGAMTDVGKGVCVGQLAAEIDARIIRISDDPIGEWQNSLELPAGEIGEIVVKGDVVTEEYIDNRRATDLAKVQDGATFWHRMGDVGYIDADGRLWFCGRKSQRVRLAAGDFFSTPVEGIFNAHPEVKRSALVAIKRQGIAEAVICIEPTRGHATARLRDELLALAQRHDGTRAIKHLLFHHGFPVDIRHNAKINRELLALWAQRKLA